MAGKRKRNGSGNNIDARLGALRADLDALQDDMKGLAGDVGDAAGSRANLVIRTAEDVAERALHLAEEAASQANKAAAQAVDDVEAWTNDNLDSVRGQVREQPLASVMLSMGAGALLGALFLRR